MIFIFDGVTLQISHKNDNNLIHSAIPTFMALYKEMYFNYRITKNTQNAQSLYTRKKLQVTVQVLL